MVYIIWLQSYRNEELNFAAMTYILWSLHRKTWWWCGGRGEIFSKILNPESFLIKLKDRYFLSLSNFSNKLKKFLMLKMSNIKLILIKIKH